MRRFFGLLALLALAGCAAPRRVQAQFIGYTSPQTTQQTLATNLTCTGSAQTFLINNLGQTQHFLNVGTVTGATQFQAELDGLDAQGNVYRISDVIENAGLAIPKQGSAYGAGYFPKIQASVTCSPNTATFNLSYAGAWGTAPNNGGTYLTAQIDKVNFIQADATVSQSDTNIQTPFGSSAGTLIVSGGSTATPGSMRVRCSTNALGSVINVGVFPLAITAGLRFFPLPDLPCPFINVSYTPGTGAGTIFAETVFKMPGRSSANDPCQSPGVTKTSVAVSAAAAGTTQIVAPLTNAAVYSCGFSLSQPAAGTFQFIAGQGATCGTLTANLSGAYSTAVGTPFVYGPGASIFAPTSQSFGVCIVTTGGGATADGTFTYVQE